MTDDQEPRAPSGGTGREHGNAASEVLQKLISRAPELWSNAVVSNRDHSKGGIRTSGYEERIMGTTEHGARIQVINSQFKAEQTRMVPHYNHRGEFTGTREVWDITDDIHGINIVVVAGSGDKRRRLEMFIPDDPGAEELYRAHKIELQTAKGEQLLMPKNGQAFDKALAEVEYYLGEPIEWDEKPPSFEEELSI